MVVIRHYSISDIKDVLTVSAVPSMENQLQSLCKLHITQQVNDNSVVVTAHTIVML